MLINLKYIEDIEAWLTDPKNLYIGRGTNTLKKSKWHNPFTVEVYGREEAVRKYKDYLINNKELIQSIGELRGKLLAVGAALFCATASFSNS